MGRSRGRGRGKKLAPITDRQPAPEEQSPPPVGVAKRGRGRPSSSGTSGKVVASPAYQRLSKTLPRDENDDLDATCSECGKASSYREFRIHNIQVHANTACTVLEREELVIDHKYFSRKLNEYRKITKATVFPCPKENCGSTFKSTLGLAYHMNTCGRSAEEIDAVLIQCEICNVKLTLPNMGWHRKTHHQQPAMVESDEDKDSESVTIKQLVSGKSTKRRSAVKARQSFKKFSNKDGDADNDNDDEWEDANVAGPQSQSEPTDVPMSKNDQSQPSDFCNLAYKFVERLEHEAKAWDEPERVDEDPFISLHDNILYDPGNEEGGVEEYLPTHKESVEFKYISQEGPSPYHRLTWFEGETVVSNASSAAVSSLHHAGGPVLSMNWHPSGKLLAVSVGRDSKEEIDSLVNQNRKSCIQIYCRSLNSLYLQLIIGIRWGYATHIQWSSFSPDMIDSYDPNLKSCFDDIEIYCRIGYIAMACEDATVRIMAIRIEDMKLPPNFEYKENHRINVYTKVPELCLKVDDSAVDYDLGNVVKFDWHEKNRFMAVGYANGVVAVFDLQTTSPLLTQTTCDDNAKITVINPFWTFHGHRLPVRGIRFDPMNPRYLVTASQDRTIKVWDTYIRAERDNKRVGIALDLCWVRGWMHQIAAFETFVSNQSAMYNYVRVFQIGSGTGRATCPEIFNPTTVDFYHGLTIQGTDDGLVSATYYDIFWRECDFERNRKKKNLVRLSNISIDRSSYTPINSSDFSVTLKKLTNAVMSSKAYLEPAAVDEYDGTYQVCLEGKFCGMDIFEPLPNTNTVDGSLKKTINPVGVDIKTMNAKAKRRKSVNRDEDENEGTLNQSHQGEKVDIIQKSNNRDGLLPVFDVNIRDETPKVILSFVKERPNSAVPNDKLELAKFEELIRFQPFLRVNKVSWSPKGDVIAVGYRNGLISLIPGSFDDIFAT
ncbi:unnamed protein product [Orchesella dallaii]|uniref:C2H2-type domain-containing protein n=1 Tax=Orchesella dallaii TaxID=48710 RepID=A0ABP1S589_9HEXA